VAGSCGCGNEPPGSIKYGNFSPTEQMLASQVELVSWLGIQAYIPVH